MMPDDSLHSPVLHRTIYLEDAIRDALQWCKETYGIAFEVISKQQGWSLILTPQHTPHEDCARLLKQVLNEVLVRSLETRLEDKES